MTDTGWELRDTPDGGPWAFQDHYFLTCLDVIISTWNIVLAENQNG